MDLISEWVSNSLEQRTEIVFSEVLPGLAHVYIYCMVCKWPLYILFTLFKNANISENVKEKVIIYYLRISYYFQLFILSKALCTKGKAV